MVAGFRQGELRQRSLTTKTLTSGSRCRVCDHTFADRVGSERSGWTGQDSDVIRGEDPIEGLTKSGVAVPQQLRDYLVTNDHRVHSRHPQPCPRQGLRPVLLAIFGGRAQPGGPTRDRTHAHQRYSALRCVLWEPLRSASGRQWAWQRPGRSTSDVAVCLLLECSWSIAGWTAQR